MTVTYPRKFQNTLGARDILKQVVGDRELHLITLNRYRYSEQRSCKDLTEIIEKLDGQVPDGTLTADFACTGSANDPD